MNAPRVWVVPARDEADTIEKTVYRIRAVDPTATICVVDDGSTDETEELARAAGADHVVSTRAERGSYARAVLRGLRYSVEHWDPGHVVVMDAGEAWDPRDAGSVLEHQKSDVAAAWRAVSYARRDRKVLSWLARKAVAKVVGLSCRDATAGFRVYSRKAVNHILMFAYRYDKLSGHWFNAAVLADLALSRLTFEWFPAVYAGGGNRLPVREVLRAARDAWRLWRLG